MHRFGGPLWNGILTKRVGVAICRSVSLSDRTLCLVPTPKRVVCPSALRGFYRPRQPTKLATRNAAALADYAREGGRCAKALDARVALAQWLADRDDEQS